MRSELKDVRRAFAIASESESAVCILYIESACSTIFSLLKPHSQTDNSIPLTDVPPPGPVKLCAIGLILAFNSTRQGQTARKGHLRCLDE